jgi:hypothetical protein
VTNLRVDHDAVVHGSGTRMVEDALFDHNVRQAFCKGNGDREQEGAEGAENACRTLLSLRAPVHFPAEH